MGFNRSRNYIFAEIEINNFDSSKLLSEYLLKLEIILRINPSKKTSPVTLQNLSIELVLTGKNYTNISLGNMFSLKGPRIHFASEDYAKESREEFGIKLSHRDIAKIEETRNGGDILFEFKFNGTIVEDSDFLPVFETRQHQIEQSKWISILSKMEYAKIINIEVTTTGVNSNPDYQESYSRLLDAQNAFFRSDWKQSVALCRDSIESMPCFDEGDKNIKPNNDNTKQERIRLIRQKLTHLTHLAKHSKDDLTKNTKWTREDALLAIAMTGSIINNLSKNEQ